MIRLTPISIAATAQQYLVTLAERLCQGYCVNSVVQPTGTVTFTVAGQQTAGTQTIVTINAAAVVTYQPKGCCKSVVKQWSEQFEVAFIGTAGAVPTVAITPLATVVSDENVKCGGRAYGISLATPLTIGVTYPA